MSPGGPDDLDPFERLENTHRRIEERLASLQAASVEGDLETIDGVLGFFARAAVRHHEDEERSLFPRLRNLPELSALITALEAEHRAHESARADVEASRGDPVRLRDAVALLAAVYRAHIDREEKELFPAARRALDEATRRTICEEMAERRGGGGGGGGGSGSGGGRAGRGRG